MSLILRDKWPLYIVTEERSGYLNCQQIRLDNLVLVTSSFAFARLVSEHLDRSCDSKTRLAHDVVRVTHHNRFLPVSQQSSEFMARLDQHWTRPPSVVEAHCQLGGDFSVSWVLRSVTVLAEPAAPCARHNNNASRGSLVTLSKLHEVATNSSHKQLRLNVFNKHWPAANSADARAALQSAKLAWIGPLYFARALRGLLPAECLEHIVELATSYQQLVR